MNRTDAEQWLTQWFEATPEVTLDLISRALVLVADAAGRGPVESGYIETVDQWLSAAAVAEQLALRGAMTSSAGGVKRFTSEGTTIEVEGGGGVDWLTLAARFRARSPLLVDWPAGMGRIVVEASQPYYARSGGVL